MRTYAALIAIVTATAAFSPMALAKGKSPSVAKVQAAVAPAKHTVKKSVKREIPARSVGGRFLPRKKA